MLFKNTYPTILHQDPSITRYKCIIFQEVDQETYV